MVFAAELGEALGQTEPGTASRLEAILKAYGLPTRTAGFSPSRILKAMERDKKRGAAGLRWVLLSRLGQARVVEKIPEAVVKRELHSFLRGESYTRHSALSVARPADGKRVKEIAI
jgi:3-dehydroquinate synthase